MAEVKTTEEYIAGKLTGEVTQAKANLEYDMDNYEAAIDLIENVRAEKDYDWMSNASIPEYAIHFLTQAAHDGATYFQTRDFVEVYHEDETDEAMLAAKANKNLINRTLNQRHLHHYAKYMRAKLSNNAFGNCVARCWWEQERKDIKTGVRAVPIESKTVDVDGNPIITEEQTPRIEVIEEDVIEEIAVIDRFNWDVVDPRNVFYDNSYAYSLQDKKWVTFRYEASLDRLEKDAEEYRYINLDKLKEVPPPEQTETSRESYNKDEDWQPAAKNVDYDIYERHGLEWCVVEEEDEFGYPAEVSFGYDLNGNILDNATLEELIVTVAVSGSKEVLIRFVPQIFKDATGKPYRPLIRGNNYIHPSKDGGIGDATYSRDLQMLINDTVNMSNDRVKLATLPTFKGAKYALEGNDTIYFAPEHVIELYHKDDLEEFKVSSDISGAVEMLALATTKLQQVNAASPPATGDLPSPSTTATAIAGAERHANTRLSYRSLTWEYTFLTELYWMITQMTAQFATLPTATKLFGGQEGLMAFRPDYEFFYQPVTGTIETEYSKANKIKEAISIMQIVGQSPNPNAAKVFNLLLVNILNLWGMDKKQYADALMASNEPMTEQQGPASTPETERTPGSNQEGIPMSVLEQETRGI